MAVRHVPGIRRYDYPAGGWGALRATAKAIAEQMTATEAPSSKVPWLDLIADYDRIRNGIESVFPEFESFNERIRVPGGFRLPLPPTERVWPTKSGKAEFIPFKDVKEDPAIAADDVLKLTTIRSHDQYNTTIYGLDDRYRGVFGRRDVVLMNEDDLAERNIEHGDVIVVETAIGNGRKLYLLGFIAIAYKIARGSVADQRPTASCRLTISTKRAGHLRTNQFPFASHAIPAAEYAHTLGRVRRHPMAAT